MPEFHELILLICLFVILCIAIPWYLAVLTFIWGIVVGYMVVYEMDRR